jgi:hypothetical protein
MAAENGALIGNVAISWVALTGPPRKGPDQLEIGEGEQH